ncbi:MAG: aminodeoxychorismate/anthranilate synthase component II [Pseudomonadota bacterium]
MLLLIDNYDSFTYNLVHYLGELGAETLVRRNDALSVDEALGMGAEAVIISPGPGTPDQAGICLDLVRAAPEEMPIFGVCLGHQTIGQAFGGTIGRAPSIMHGKLSQVSHNNRGIFHGAPQDLNATRYHSLIVERESLPDCLEVTAETADGTIMGLSHRTRPIHGVQFHPESIRTLEGKGLMRRFLTLAEVTLTKAA